MTKKKQKTTSSSAHTAPRKRHEVVRSRNDLRKQASAYVEKNIGDVIRRLSSE